MVARFLYLYCEGQSLEYYSLYVSSWLCLSTSVWAVSWLLTVTVHIHLAWPWMWSWQASEFSLWLNNLIFMFRCQVSLPERSLSYLPTCVQIMFFKFSFLYFCSHFTNYPHSQPKQLLGYRSHSHHFRAIMFTSLAPPPQVSSSAGMSCKETPVEP